MPGIERSVHSVSMDDVHFKIRSKVMDLDSSDAAQKSWIQKIRPKGVGFEEIRPN